jgi:hypothetical protein
MAEQWEDEDPSVVPAVNGIPADARKMGLSRHTEEGALLDFAGSLNATKPSHRLMAWVMLTAFAAPAVLTILAAIL